MAKPQYGAAHQRERKRWRKLVDQGGVNCCLCDRAIPPGSPFDLDHEPNTTNYRGAACPGCNRRDGAVRGNLQRAGVTRWKL